MKSVIARFIQERPAKIVSETKSKVAEQTQTQNSQQKMDEWCLKILFDYFGNS